MDTCQESIPESHKATGPRSLPKINIPGPLSPHTNVSALNLAEWVSSTYP
jgi:hypothetical protein